MKLFIFILILGYGCAKPAPMSSKTAKDWSYSDTISGKVISGKIANLSIPRAGIITQVITTPGVLVKKGDILATIDTRDLVMDKRYAELDREQSSVKLAYYKKKMNKLSRLSESNLIEKKTFEEAEFEYNINNNLYDKSRLKIADLEDQIRRSKLVADENGLILKVFKNPGEYYQPDEPMLQFMVEGNKKISLEVPYYLWDRYQAGKQIKFNALVANFSGTAEIKQIVPSIHGEGETYEVIAHIINKDFKLPLGTKIYIDHKD